MTVDPKTPSVDVSLVKVDPEGLGQSLEPITRTLSHLLTEFLGPAATQAGA